MSAKSCPPTGQVVSAVEAVIAVEASLLADCNAKGNKFFYGPKVQCNSWSQSYDFLGQSYDSELQRQRCKNLQHRE
jgi:hypothetical protein